MSNTPSLYSATLERLRIQELLEENEGELDEELAAAFDLSEGQLAVKAGGLLDWLEELDATVQMGEAKIEQAQQFIAAKKKTIERIKNTLKNAVLVTGRPIVVDTRTVKVSKSEAVVLAADLNAQDLPAEFRRTVTPPVKIEPDKKALAKALKAGQVIKGASIETRYSLSVK